MDNEELNKKIHEICDQTDLYEAFGGKCIPYIGWFWRNVDFNADGCYFGVLSDGKIGFMENNKWDYEEFYCSGNDWQDIKKLLIEAVSLPTKKSLMAVDFKIQSLE